MADQINENTYVQHEWEDGELITTAKMNNIENAIQYLSGNLVTDETVNNAVRTAV